MRDDKKNDYGQRTVYRDQLLTRQDLEEFKEELDQRLEKLLKELSGDAKKKWLKSWEVKKLLGISPGTLQSFRQSGKLPYTKIGNILLYDADEINRMLAERKSVGKKDRTKGC